MTQQERLLAHLKTSRSIDPMTALERLGIYRLGARIYDLRRAGHDITMNLVPVPSRFDDRVRVAEYTLISTAK